jgi:hypothetical protein
MGAGSKRNYRKFVKIRIPEKIKNIFGGLLTAAVLFLSIIWGVSTGQKIAQATIVSQTANNLVAAVQYFYQDQNRYPTELEFSNQTIMLNYLTQFPAPDFVSGVCSQSFVYKQITADNFQLNFCLPTAEGSYPKGWSVINGSPGM